MKKWMFVYDETYFLNIVQGEKTLISGVLFSVGSSKLELSVPFKIADCCNNVLVFSLTGFLISTLERFNIIK